MNNQRNKKKVSLTSEDISVNRGVVTKISVVNVDKPDVVHINLSFFAIPKKQMRPVEYEKSVEVIKEHTRQSFLSYICKNRDLFNRRHIMELNFSTANLRKGYNKSVKFSLYLKQNAALGFKELQRKVKGTIKGTVADITDNIRKNGFICSKQRVGD